MPESYDDRNLAGARARKRIRFGPARLLAEPTCRGKTLAGMRVQADSEAWVKTSAGQAGPEPVPAHNELEMAGIRIACACFVVRQGALLHRLVVGCRGAGRLTVKG